jgi:hypothetical protein
MPRSAPRWTRICEHGPNCGGELKIIAAILERPVMEKVLTHLAPFGSGRPAA